LELLARMAAEGKNFIVGCDWKWNIFDALVVLSAIIEKLLANVNNLSFIRLLRITRTFRAVRVIRLMRFLRELRVMVASVVESFVNLLWALLFLFSTMYLFAVVFVQGAMSYLDGSDPDEAEKINTLDGYIPDYAEALVLIFPSLGNSILCLFASVTGGVDWFNMYEIVVKLSPFYGGLFVIYISFMLVGVVNVILGIFVDNANRSSHKERTTICHEIGPDLADVKQALLESKLQEDDSLSEGELMRCLEKESFIQILDRHEIDKTVAVGVFSLLRDDVCAGPDEVNIDEFLIGLLHAKDSKKDMISLWYESKQLGSKILEFLVFVNSHFEYLERATAEQHEELRNSVSEVQKDVAALRDDARMKSRVNSKGENT